MRQAGVLAAAGIYALEHHVERLAEDHARAKVLAERLADIPQLTIKPEFVQTNMVFIKTEQQVAEGLAQYLEQKGVKIIAAETMRWVLHLDISKEDLHYACDQVHSYFNSQAGA